MGSALWVLMQVLAVFAVWAGPSAALAHPDLDRAVSLSADLDFQKALKAFDRALDSGTLTRDELTQLLAERALLLHALRRKDDVESDFVWLAAIAPSYQLDARAPPDLTAVWDRVRNREGGPTRVELLLERRAGNPRLRPLLEGPQPEGLEVTTFWRRAGGPYEQHAGTQPVEPSVREGETLEAYATLKGPGGVVFAGKGTAEQPLSWLSSDDNPERVLLATSSPGKDGENKRRRKWIWIGSVAAVVVVGIVTTAVLVSGASDEERTRLMPVATF